MFRVVYLVLAVLAAVCNAEEFETAPHPQGRIKGGSDASIYDFPHQVSVNIYGKHRAGGSIYSKNVIITLASWVYYLNVTDVKIVAGTSLLSDPKIEVGVEKIIPHRKYDFVDQDYNVALMILSSPLPLGPGIQPIPLAKKRPPVGTTATVTGWGFLYQYGDLPDQLQKVDVNVWSKIDCIKTHIFITGRMICAAFAEGGRDACSGDEGGPLISNNELLGVLIPYVMYCGNVGQPKVYISVPDIYYWIVETAEQNTNSFA